jgi:hypothetical protein
MKQGLPGVPTWQEYLVSVRVVFVCVKLFPRFVTLLIYDNRDFLQALALA